MARAVKIDALRSTRETLIKQAADEVRLATHNVKDGKYNTEHVRETASLLIDLRATFYDKNGNVDMMGNSYAYRTAVKEIMSRAGVPESERARVMNAVRYHLGNVLRDRFTPEQLEDMGFIAETPIERQRRDRERRSKVMRVAVTPNEEIREPEEILAALRAAANLLDNIDIKSLSAVDRKVGNLLLDHLSDRVKAMTAG